MKKQLVIEVSYKEGVLDCEIDMLSKNLERIDDKHFKVISKISQSKSYYLQFSETTALDEAWQAGIQLAQSILTNPVTQTYTIKWL